MLSLACVQILSVPFHASEAISWISETKSKESTNHNKEITKYEQIEKRQNMNKLKKAKHDKMEIIEKKNT